MLGLKLDHVSKRGHWWHCAAIGVRVMASAIGRITLLWLADLNIGLIASVAMDLRFSSPVAISTVFQRPLTNDCPLGCAKRLWKSLAIFPERPYFFRSRCIKWPEALKPYPHNDASCPRWLIHVGRRCLCKQYPGSIFLAKWMDILK